MSDFMPWNIFDGKLFHQKYLQSEKGYAVEVLLEQNRSRLTKFHNLKAVVCKACMKENRRITGRAHWGSHHAGRWEDRAPATTGRALGIAVPVRGSRGETRDQEADSMSMTSGEGTSRPPERAWREKEAHLDAEPCQRPPLLSQLQGDHACGSRASLA